MFTRKFLAVATAAGVALPAFAHHDGEAFDRADVTVSHVHTVAVSEASHAIDLYMTIENTGDAPVTLTGAEVDFAQSGVFQAPVVGEDGAMSVREVSSVEIAAGQTLTMQPGGVHVVLNDVQAEIEERDHFHANLTFAEFGEIEVEVEVEHENGAPHDHDGEDVPAPAGETS